MANRADFSQRRQHLAALSDEQLRQRFWDLAKQVVSPMVDMARTHTSPSIERSVLLRMGFSSLEAKGIVDRCQEHGLLGKGAGHAVVKLADLKKLPYREAGLELSEGRGWDELKQLWQGGNQ